MNLLFQSSVDFCFSYEEVVEGAPILLPRENLFGDSCGRHKLEVEFREPAAGSALRPKT